MQNCCGYFAPSVITTLTFTELVYGYLCPESPAEPRPSQVQFVGVVTHKRSDIPELKRKQQPGA